MLMSFATPEDVARRLSLDLSDGQRLQVESLLNAASAVIAECVGKDEAGIDPVPSVVKFVCVEAVCRTMANPQGLASEQESLGAYSHSQNFGRDGTGIMLTKNEQLIVRRAVYGKTTDSPRDDLRSLDDYSDLEFYGELDVGS